MKDGYKKLTADEIFSLYDIDNENFFITKINFSPLDSNSSETELFVTLKDLKSLEEELIFIDVKNSEKESALKLFEIIKHVFQVNEQ